MRPYQKMDALCRVLDSEGFRKALVFCATKRNVDEITVHLQQRGYQADGLHGDLNQTQRDRVMGRFRSDGLEILVATDVAARGIDVDDVDAVINYDIPHDVEGYVHRIGRTGRAGRVGRAFTFVTVREQYKIREITRYTKARITQGQLPTLRDVHNIRTSKLLEEVRSTLAEGALDRWRLLVEDFQAENFPEGEAVARDMAAALLKLLMQRDFGAQEAVSESDPLAVPPRPAFDDGPRNREQRPRRRESGPMSRLHLNVGRTHGATPRALVGAITGESGISGQSIGAIDHPQRLQRGGSRRRTRRGRAGHAQQGRFHKRREDIRQDGRGPGPRSAPGVQARAAPPAFRQIQKAARLHHGPETVRAVPGRLTITRFSSFTMVILL